MAGAAAGLNAQTDASNRPMTGNREAGADEARNVKEMLAKHRAIRDKKDHEEMLKRGEEAVLLSKQLENAFEKNNQLSRQDRLKLESLEKIVHKIRRELGGDDDDEDENDEKPSTPREAFNILQATTVQLVNELKKTSRFSISAIAIQSSNSVLRLVKFLRLRS